MIGPKLQHIKFLWDSFYRLADWDVDAHLFLNSMLICPR